MKKEKWKTFVTDRWKVAAPGLLAAFAVCFIFFIYAPLELYVTNQTEFWFDFYKILKAVLQNFALFFGLNVLGILLAACISKVFCRFVTAAELVVLLTLYVQGNFLVNHMPPFDGTEIVWEDYRGENIKTAIVCILIAAAVVTVAKLLGAKRFQGICMAVSAGLSGILMITLVTMTVTTGAYRERTTYYALENGQYRLSQDQNFLVLLLDAVDAKTFEEVMDSDPAYTETFADFTYYPDMVGAYPWTAFSVPYILSGKWYEGEEYYLDYAAAAVDESGLFRELSERDYDIALYESDPWVTTYTYQFSNMVELQHEAYVWKYFRRAICKLGGIRYAPFFLKEYCYRAIVQRDFISALLKQTLKPGNIFKLGEILEIAHKNVETNLELSYIKDYIPYAVEFNTDNLQTATLPGTTPDMKDTNNVSIFVINKKLSTELIQSMFYVDSTEETEDNTITNNINTSSNSISSTTTVKDDELKIELINGSGNTSKLEEAKTKLEEAGFKVNKTGKQQKTIS